MKLNILDEIWNLIFELGRILRQSSHKGQLISFVQFGTLHFIGEERPTMKQIADYLKITAPSATALVDDLSRSGYIVRMSDPEDRRTVRIKLSKKGEKVLKQSVERKGRIMKGSLRKLSRGERKILVRILSKIVKNA